MLTNAPPPGMGKSKAAESRRKKSHPGKVYSGRHLDEIEMSRGRKYVVARDGSFRRVKA